MRRKRSLLLSITFLIASFLAVTAKRLFDYSAAPAGEKQSDFVFPHNDEQMKPTTLTVAPSRLLVTLLQRGGFINDASHLNRTAIYGIAKIATEDDIRNALQFARENRLKVTCAGQRHSMGGQTFSKDGLVLELKDFNRIQLDREHKVVNVQSGVRWWQLQQLLESLWLLHSCMFETHRSSFRAWKSCFSYLHWPLS